MMTQQQITVQADQQLSITLPAGVWSQILTVIQEAPISWIRAQPLISVLHEQMQQAVAARPQGSVPNGHDTSEPHFVPPQV